MTDLYLRSLFEEKCNGRTAGSLSTTQGSLPDSLIALLVIPHLLQTWIRNTLFLFDEPPIASRPTTL